MNKKRKLRLEFISFKLIELRFAGMAQHEKEMRLKCEEYFNKFPYKNKQVIK